MATTVITPQEQGHAINQTVLRRIVKRFSTPATAKRPSPNTRGVRPDRVAVGRPLGIAKEALQALNSFVVQHAHRLFGWPSADPFKLVLDDANRVRLDHTWFCRRVCPHFDAKTHSNIKLVMARKQFEQHLTHVVTAACNATLDQRRVIVKAVDVLRAAHLAMAILNRPDRPVNVRLFQHSAPTTAPVPRKRKRDDDDAMVIQAKRIPGQPLKLSINMGPSQKQTSSDGGGTVKT